MVIGMDNRKDCPMRHENGNCLPVGGFCTAVNDSICEALHNAYRHGESDERDRLVLSMIDANAKYQERQLKILRNIHKRVTEDTVPVVRCNDCKYFKPAYFKADDGTETTWDETFSFNDRSDGIHYGARCKHERNTAYGQKDMAFRKADDFCSYGERREGE